MTISQNHARELPGAALAAGADDVDLHELVAHDVESHQEQSILHDLRDVQSRLVDLGLLPPAWIAEPMDRSRL